MIGVDKSGMGQLADFSTKNARRSKTSARGLFAIRDTLLPFLVIIVLLSAIAALFVLVAGPLNVIPGFLGSYLDGWLDLTLLSVARGWGVIIAVVLGVGGMFFAFLARSRFVHNPSVYVEAGCPHCYELRLKRIQRRKRDRLLRIAGLPAWHYACQFCTWQGLRLMGNAQAVYGNVIAGAEVEKGHLMPSESKQSVNGANGDFSTQPLLAVDFGVDPEIEQEAPDAGKSVPESKYNDIDFARLCLEVVRAKK